MGSLRRCEREIDFLIISLQFCHPNKYIRVSPSKKSSELYQVSRQCAFFIGSNLLNLFCL